MNAALVLLALLLALLAGAQAIQGEIISCGEIRRFLKESGHADAYAPRLKVTFVQGRNPELFIKDDMGNNLETIDLSPLSTDQIHQLMVSKGFERNARGRMPIP